MGIRSGVAIRIVSRTVSRRPPVSAAANFLPAKPPFKLQPLFAELVETLTVRETRSFANAFRRSGNKHPSAPLKLGKKLSAKLRQLQLLDVVDDTLTEKAVVLLSEEHVWPPELDFAIPAEITPAVAMLHNRSDATRFCCGDSSLGRYYTNTYFMNFNAADLDDDRDLHLRVDFRDKIDDAAIEKLIEKGKSVIRKENRCVVVGQLSGEVTDFRHRRKGEDAIALLRRDGTGMIMDPLFGGYFLRKYGTGVQFYSEGPLSTCSVVVDGRLQGIVMPRRHSDGLELMAKMAETYENFSLTKLFGGK